MKHPPISPPQSQPLSSHHSFGNLRPAPTPPNTQKPHGESDDGLTSRSGKGYALMTGEDVEIPQPTSGKIGHEKMTRKSNRE